MERVVRRVRAGIADLDRDLAVEYPGA